MSKQGMGNLRRYLLAQLEKVGVEVGMSMKYVTYEKKGRIAVVTINRPEVLNSLHPPATNEMCQVWSDFRDDPDIWVAILTGSGDKAFCAGNDLKYTALHPEILVDPTVGLPPGFGFGGLTQFECWKPVIAALNGFALGGGLELALACDIIVASETATIGLPEPKVGLFAGAGGPLRLPRLIPQKLAMGMLLTGRQVSALEAYRFGLINQVVPQSELMKTARTWAEEIAECAPLSVQATKQMAILGQDEPLSTALVHGYPLMNQLTQSVDAIEGPKAFVERRKPVWLGR